MKALILTSTTSPKVKAGVEAYSEQLAKVFPGSEIIGTERAGKNAFEGFPPLREPLRALSVCRHAEKACNMIKPDIVIAHGMYSWALRPEKVGRPVINISHGTFAGLADNAIPKVSPEYYRTRFIYSHFEKTGAKNADAVVSNSKLTQELNRKYYGVESKVIRNFVDTEIFRPIGKEKARKKLGIDDEGRLGLFVGRQEYQKGFDLLEEIAVKMQGTKFISITSPITSDAKAGNIAAVPPVGREELALYYNAADFVVFPSRFEGFGFVICEALACNTPVVSSEVGIALEIEIEGLEKVGSRNAEDWKNAIGRLPEKCDSGKFMRENFSTERFSAEFIALAETLQKKSIKTSQWQD
ncbi:D-inositol-3-phosphate glycosyltransferase [uncultured archaeon]|nr:D-inositol-3-phosphate glycosyltransferase [uncultured archaeon]